MEFKCTPLNGDLFVNATNHNVDMQIYISHRYCNVQRVRLKSGRSWVRTRSGQPKNYKIGIWLAGNQVVWHIYTLTVVSVTYLLETLYLLYTQLYPDFSSISNISIYYLFIFKHEFTSAFGLLYENLLNSIEEKVINVVFCD